MAPIEGQKRRVVSFQMGGHVDLVAPDGEVGQAPLKREQRLRRVPVGAVLVDRVAVVLVFQRLFELGREEG